LQSHPRNEQGFHEIKLTLLAIVVTYVRVLVNSICERTGFFSLEQHVLNVSEAATKVREDPVSNIHDPSIAFAHKLCWGAAITNVLEISTAAQIRIDCENSIYYNHIYNFLS
jgi:hypothetical protein